MKANGNFFQAALKKPCLTAMLAVSITVLHAQVSFVGNGQQLNQASGRNVVLGDFNKDGALDAFVVNAGDYRVYFGDGRGQFSDGGQRLTSFSGWTTPAAGDLNGDGRLEVITGKTIWMNDGQGRFTAQTGAIETGESGDLSVKLADLNGDGRLDIFAIRNYAAMRVYLNDGSGRFLDSGQRLGDGTIGGGQLAHIALGDIDGSGSFDAVTAGWRWNGSTQCPNHVWLNDGQGVFRDSGQLLDEGASHVHGLALGDFNGDGRPDLVMGIQDAARSGRIYLNDGSGLFTGGGNLGGARGENAALGDFDGDGSLDVFTALSAPPSRVWLNDGKGIFRDSGLRLGPVTCWNWDAAAGDFNGDGKTDVFVVACMLADVSQGAPAQVWLNATSPAKVEDENGGQLNPCPFHLNQNAPNPFNPSTTIRYHLNKASDVQLAIYDMTGQKIRILQDSFQNEGEYSLMWNATDGHRNPVSSGIYFCLLEAGGQVLHQKMILIR
jgi:hypothetical protein